MENKEKGGIKDDFQVTDLTSRWIEVFFVRCGFSSVVENLGVIGAVQDFCLDSVEWNRQAENYKLVKRREE